ncbi:MAG TPA: double zinc ribbon domain-containing protein [Gaiellaceae bacterium]|nr:double zinc ribbon domain-containing protein [Gaiellaceae bacterium]
MLLDIVLPQRCVVCRHVGAQLCGACRANLPRVCPPHCERCGTPTVWPVSRCAECSGRRLAFARARSAVVYDDAVRTLVAAWKERGLRSLAREAATVVAELLEPAQAPLAFVPPDPERRRRRGDHAAGALARELATRWDVPLLQLLERRPGQRQRGLSREQRRANVRGAFSSRPAPRRVVLVDDVYTSGATANAAASALRRAGARRVEVVTFARVVLGYTVRTQARSPPRGGRVATSGEGPEPRDQ